MASMNASDMHRLLEELLGEGEEYEAQAWASVVMTGPAYYAISGVSVAPGTTPSMMPLSNAYCYVGLTSAHLNLVIVNAFRVHEVMNVLSIPLEKIGDVRQGGMLSGKTLRVAVGTSKMQLEFTDFTADKNDRAQAADVARIMRELATLRYR